MPEDIQTMMSGISSNWSTAWAPGNHYSMLEPLVSSPDIDVVTQRTTWHLSQEFVDICQGTRKECKEHITPRGSLYSLTMDILSAVAYLQL